MTHLYIEPMALLLARIQFACNISFHILFPSITIGLSWILLYLKLSPSTQSTECQAVYHFWVKVFSLSFALGTVSGITMSFQFGTNWPGFMSTVGNVAGPLLAYEILTAFFLEATFLGIMLFASNKVPRSVHVFSIFAVAVGTTLSAFWIISLNAWMHTPAGFHMEQGIAIVDSWWEVIFNPSMPYRLIHTLLSSLLTASFLMMGLSALRLLRYKELATKMILKRVTVIAAISIFLQIIIGDLHALNTQKHHPEVIAATEALWETSSSAPLIIAAKIDEKEHTNKFTIQIPLLSSLLLTHNIHGTVRGLNEFSEHPPVTPIFWSFRIMVGTGILMTLLSWYGCIHLHYNKKINPWFLRSCVLMTFSGWVGVLSGWYLTEIGRQPYLVHGILKTADAAGPIDATHIATTLSIYIIIYSILLLTFISSLFYMARK